MLMPGWLSKACKYRDSRLAVAVGSPRDANRSVVMEGGEGRSAAVAAGSGSSALSATCEARPAASNASNAPGTVDTTRSAKADQKFLRYRSNIAAARRRPTY